MNSTGDWVVDSGTYAHWESDSSDEAYDEDTYDDSEEETAETGYTMDTKRPLQFQPPQPAIPASHTARPQFAVCHGRGFRMTSASDRLKQTAYKMQHDIEQPMASASGCEDLIDLEPMSPTATLTTPALYEPLPQSTQPIPDQLSGIPADGVSKQIDSIADTTGAISPTFHAPQTSV